MPWSQPRSGRHSNRTPRGPGKWTPGQEVTHIILVYEAITRDLRGGAPVHLVGSIFDVAAPARQVSIKPGEWYRYVITTKGNLITVVLNGEGVNKVNLDLWKDAGRNPDGTANKFTKAYKDMARSGRIGLQDHGTPIEFRNLFVERL